MDHSVADRKHIAVMHSACTFLSFIDMCAVGSACFLSDQACNWLRGFGGWGEEQTFWQFLAVSKHYGTPGCLEILTVWEQWENSLDFPSNFSTHVHMVCCHLHIHIYTVSHFSTREVWPCFIHGRRAIWMEWHVPCNPELNMCVPWGENHHEGLNHFTSSSTSRPIPKILLKPDWILGGLSLLRPSPSQCSVNSELVAQHVLWPVSYIFNGRV